MLARELREDRIGSAERSEAMSPANQSYTPEMLADVARLEAPP